MDAELEAALQKCRDTHSGKNPCYDYEYLMARYEYHKLLVNIGLLSRKEAEPMPGKIRLVYDKGIR